MSRIHPNPREVEMIKSQKLLILTSRKLFVGPGSMLVKGKQMHDVLSDDALKERGWPTSLAATRCSSSSNPGLAIRRIQLDVSEALQEIQQLCWAPFLQGKLSTTSSSGTLTWPSMYVWQWRWCQSKSGWCSYELSPSYKDCNLNKEWELTPNKFQDFLFCTKSGKS